MDAEEKERVEMIKRLVGVQHTIRDLIDHVEAQAAACNQIGYPGLAFAINMVSESLHVYSKEVRKLIRRGVSGG